MGRSRSKNTNNVFFDAGRAGKGVNVSAVSVPSSHALKPGSNNELEKAGVTKSSISGIQFGSPSASGTSRSRSSSKGGEWNSLLQKTVSGGLQDVVGGGFLSMGLDYLASGISHLFGGTEDPPPALTRFTLPDRVSQTVYNNAGELSPLQQSASITNNGRYMNTQGAASVAQLPTAQIVQAVKTALLTSSSLNDVISDL